MNTYSATRRGVLGGAAVLASGIGTARADAAVGINIVDAAGNLALTREGFENFRKANPSRVNRITYTQATAPEIPGKLRAQQAAGRVDIDIVLGGNDVLAGGMELKLWEPLVTNHADKLPDLDKILSPMAKKLQTAAQGQAVVVVVCPGGPILEYMPDRVKDAPGSAEELLAWCRERLAAYKCPRAVTFRDELPRDPSGKLFKRLLRDPYWEGRASRIV